MMKNMRKTKLLPRKRRMKEIKKLFNFYKKSIKEMEEHYEYMGIEYVDEELNPIRIGREIQNALFIKHLSRLL